MLLAACRDEDPPSSVGAPEAAPIDPPALQLAGCDEVDADGRCRLTSTTRRLNLWVDVQAHATVVVTAAGRAVVAERRTADAGVAMEIEVPPDADTVLVGGIDPPWRQPHAIAIRRFDPPAVVAAAAALRAEGEPTAAIERLIQALGSLRGEARLAAMDELRVAHYERGDTTEMAAWVERMLALDEAPAARRTRARAASAAAWVHAYQRGDAAAARTFLAPLEALAPELPEAAVWAAFSRGLLARLLGDPTAAVDAFAEAERGADRLGMLRDQLAAMEGLAITLGELSREDEALACSQRMLEVVQTRGLGCSDRALALNTIGWVQLLLSQAGLRHLDPADVLDEALGSLQAGGECPDPTEEINVRINLALGELDRGDAAMALAWVEPVWEAPPELAAWLEEVRARAGLALGRWELVPSPLRAIEPRLSRDLRWNAAMRRAWTSERLGASDAAADAYLEAEALLEESVAAIGIDAGRELFLAGKQASARGLVAVLIASGRIEEALCRARLARARALRRLERTTRLAAAPADARAKWEAEVIELTRLRQAIDAERTEDWMHAESEQVRRRARREAQQHAASRALDRAYSSLGAVASVDECAALPPLLADEVMLASFPLDDGWAIFVADGAGVTARWVPEPPSTNLDGWVARAFGPDAARIDAAARLRILAAGRSASLRHHALPWRDGVLLDVAPVVHALDVRPPERDGAPLEIGSALVIADPSENLPLARREAEAVAGALERARWSVAHLRGSAAGRDAVGDAASRVALLHYAGHGEHRGAAGWGAALVLHGSETFGVPDVLALERAPETVVLSGCETGSITPDTLEGGMNLGRAFALAGARWVVVADTRVSDELSQAIGEGIYADVRDPTWDGAVALRRVQQALRAAEPQGDWAAFRVVVP